MKTEIDLRLLLTQKKFFLSKKRHPLYVGGYGAGKSYINTVKGLSLAVQNPRTWGMIVAPTYRDLLDVNKREWEKQLDAWEIRNKWNMGRFLVELPDFDVTVIFRSGDDPDSLKGPDLAWAGIDEIARIKEAIWGVAASRVRDPKAVFKQAFGTGTPEGLNWVFDRWVDNKRSEQYELFQAASTENYHTGEDYIDTLKESHTLKELEEKLDGQFVDMTKGVTYGSFSNDNITDDPALVFQSNHIGHIPKNIIGNPRLPLLLACDFNIDYGRWLVCQAHKDMLHVHAEIISNDSPVYTVDMSMAAVAAGLTKHPAGIQVFGDAAGKHRHTQAIMNDYQIMGQHGLTPCFIPNANPPVKSRVQLVNAMLRNSKNEIRITIDPSCKTLIKDLRRVKFVQGKFEIDKTTNPELTHISDALGYCVWYKFSARFSNSSMNIPSTVSKFMKR